MKRKLQLIQARFMKKIFSSLQKRSWKICFEFYVNPGLSQPAFEKLAPGGDQWEKINLRQKELFH